MREREVRVASELAKAEVGKKEAERDQRVSVAQLEADGVKGENEAKAEIASYDASLEVGMKSAERDQRVQTASLEASGVEGENEAQANIAAYNATLSEKRADASRRGEVALAESQRELGLPVRYVGTGEGLEHLEVFEPEAFVDAIVSPPEGAAADG